MGNGLNESRDCLYVSEEMESVEHNYVEFGCIFSILACFLLSIIYVASLYIWSSQHDRNHPTTIKRRFFSVFVMSFVSPLFLYLCTAEQILNKVSLWELLGLRIKGIVFATVIPLLLTMVLFLGPLSMQGFNGLWRLYAEPVYWWSNVRNLIWLRNHIVAPLSEEFTFRACMIPLLLPCFRPMTAVAIGPLFFGVAHFHHMIERIKTGVEFKVSLFLSCFQFLYTTLFGAYSAYLFIKTGHFVAPFIVHAFCNHMGFPDFTELSTYKPKQKAIAISLFFIGLISWCLLLKPLTNPTLYGNDVLHKIANW